MEANDDKNTDVPVDETRAADAAKAAELHARPHADPHDDTLDAAHYEAPPASLQLDHDDPVGVSAEEGRSVFDAGDEPQVIGRINVEPTVDTTQLEAGSGQGFERQPGHARDAAESPIADRSQPEPQIKVDSPGESSGVYETAASRAKSDLLACPTSEILSLSRDVDGVQLEDLGPARVPANNNLKFEPVSSDDAAPIDFSQTPPEGDAPAEPIPLSVDAVAAAGGVALTLGMPGPQDNPSPDVASKAVRKKSGFFIPGFGRKAQAAKSVKQGSKRPGRSWFIPKSGKPPQDRQAGRVDKFAAVCAAGVLAVMGVLAARVVQLQVFPEQKIAALKDTQFSTATIHHRRGNIEDRNGRPLAATTAGKSVFIDPGLITDAKAFSEQVGPALNIQPAQLQATIDASGNKRYVKIVKRASHEQTDNLSDLKKVKPLGTQTILVRDYPYKTLAAHLLGFVDMDGKGIEGVERMFNSQLSGKAGGFTYNRDARHRSLWINDGNYRLPEDGQPVRLSIDITIQRIAERELADACRKFEAKSGAALVMSPVTGEILGMAVYPEIDANSFGKADPELRKNHAITDVYEPGSTFKPFIWAVATEQGYARPMEMLDCGPGRWVSSTGRRLKDAHPVGRATWEEVLVKSSNIGMAIIGERMGREPLYNAIAAFGFGKKTGSGLPGEVSGIFHPTRRWTSYSITSLPMGHEISVTPLQVARAYCALANGGVLVTPTIKYVDPDSPEARTPQGPRAIKEETAIHTRNVMRRAVLEGTGKQANSKLYSIFGKTGTAQMPNPRGGGYEPDAYVGSFVCGAPVDDAKVVVLTIIQRPNRKLGYYGGTVAAPAGMRIVEQTLAYMGVAPDIQPDQDNRKPKSPDLSGRVMSVGNR